MLALARHDRKAAELSLAQLPVEAQVALVCEAPVPRRAELLGLLPEPERIVPALPEAELCFTVKAVGLADAGWILEHASDEQLQACVDLDAWAGPAPDRDALDAWLEAVAGGGDDSLVRAARALDPELLALWLRDRVDAVLMPNDDPAWQPPAGARTLDGQFFLVAHRSEDDLALPLRLLGGLFQRDYWFYFRLLQAVSWESTADNEEWALRWRNGRLQDLGFPEWEEAMAIYGRLRAEERDRLPEAAPPLGEWHLPIWMPQIPTAEDAVHSLFRAAATLGDEERRSFGYAFLALVNKVAVADRLPLGDVDSLPRALEKSARIASRGLDHLAARHGIPGGVVLVRAGVDRLFRVGASLDPEQRSP